MSALLHIKNLIVARLVCEPELKKGIMGVMNSIDSDLDDAGYETSTDTDEAIAELDKILIGMDDEDEEVLPEEPEENATFDNLFEDLEVTKTEEVEDDEEFDDEGVE